MREIKFRAWDGFKMIKNFYLSDNGIIYFNSDPHGVDMSGKVRIFQSQSTKLKLMQYTGLCDKNGKDIWEGDIIQGNLIKYSPLPTMGRIVWDKFYSAFANNNDAGNTLLFEINQIKIIGNIYEDNELLN